LVVLVFFLLGIFVQGEGTVSSVVSDTRAISKMTITWATSTNGWASDTIDGISGELLRFVIPANTVTNITLTDAEGVDILFGKGGPLSGTLVHSWTEFNVTNLSLAVDGLHTLLITNAPAPVTTVTNGTLILYFR